jgi:hypothetical protein
MIFDDGGEEGFVGQMVEESRHFQTRCKYVINFSYPFFIILLTNFLVPIDDDDGIAAPPALSPPYQHVKTCFPPPHPSFARNVSRRGVSSLPLPTTTPLLPPSLETRDGGAFPPATVLATCGDDTKRFFFCFIHL